MIRDFSWSLVSKILFNVFSFILTPLLANELGDFYGVIAFFAAYTGFCAFTDGGFSYLIVKALNDSKTIEETFLASEISFIGSSLTIFSISLLLIVTTNFLPEATTGMIILGMGEGFLRLYMRLLRSYNNASNCLVSYSKREILYGCGRFILLVIYLFAGNPNLSTVLLLMTVSNLLFIINERMKINYKINLRAYLLWNKNDLNFIVTHTFLSLLASINVYLDKILIKGTMANSIYIDFMLAYKFSFIILILSNPIATIFIRYFAKKDRHRFQIKFIFNLIILSTIIYLLIYFISPTILGLWLGERLNDNIITLSRILIFGALAMLIGQIPYTFFISRNANKFQISMAVLGTILTLINILIYYLTNNTIQLAIGSTFIFSIITIIYFSRFYKHVST